MMKLNHYLTTYQAPAEKYRLGKERDGGYVIVKQPVGSYDAYISAGVSDEESFSRDFIKEHGLTKSECFAFDGTIEDYPYEYTRDITFIKKNIGPENTDTTTNLSDILCSGKYKNILLKMDIEGGEYPWILSLTESFPTAFENVRQITMEFHGINDNSWGMSYDNKIECFRRLTATHYIVHAHGNNWGGVCYYNNIPNVIELTFLRKDIMTIAPQLNQTDMPVAGLDFPNKFDAPDIPLNFPPFNWK